MKEGSVVLPDRQSKDSAKAESGGLKISRLSMEQAQGRHSAMGKNGAVEMV